MQQKALVRQNVCCYKYIDTSKLLYIFYVDEQIKAYSQLGWSEQAVCYLEYIHKIKGNIFVNIYAQLPDKRLYPVMDKFVDKIT